MKSLQQISSLELSGVSCYCGAIRDRLISGTKKVDLLAFLVEAIEEGTSTVILGGHSSVRRVTQTRCILSCVSSNRCLTHYRIA